MVIKRPNIIIGLIFFSLLMGVPLDVARAANLKSKYLEAEASYNKLSNDAVKRDYRHNWLSCIKRFQNVYKEEPSGPFAPVSLYMAGKLYHELYRRSSLAEDKKGAKESFEQLIARFPTSEYKRKAEMDMQQIMSRVNGAKSPPADKSAAIVPDKEEPAALRAELSQSPGSSKSSPSRVSPTNTNGASGLATIAALRHWSNPSYTRIVIDADQAIAYTHQLIKPDTVNNKPQRICVDLESSRLAGSLQKVIPINDNLLSDARAAQYKLDSVRVVADIKSFTTYKIFSLRNPFRIVLDVWGEGGGGGGGGAAKTEQSIDVSAAPETTTAVKGSMGKSALARQLALGVKRIVIDAGHGGKDFGAPGYISGVHEKDVTLKIARRLAEKVRSEIGCDVVMTRNSDQYLTLEERTAIANTHNADLFVSVHTNAHRDSRVFGLETYFLNLATDNDAILVAARENATSTKNISDLQTILNDLMQNAKINESSRLAAYVQSSLHQSLQKNYDLIKNKGVKQAPFYVLLGAQMPAILVETSFISNARECERLVNATYQERLTDAIISGIKTYIKEINPTALMNRQQQNG
jgi:N-acetylmuramoyl-L-alanine amidase